MCLAIQVRENIVEPGRLGTTVLNDAGVKHPSMWRLAPAGKPPAHRHAWCTKGWVLQQTDFALPRLLEVLRAGDLWVSMGTVRMLQAHVPRPAPRLLAPRH